MSSSIIISETFVSTDFVVFLLIHWFILFIYYTNGSSFVEYNVHR